MTREEAKKLLPFIQAFSEGKKIQWLKPDSDEWIDVVGGDNVDFEDLTECNVAYRIKPEPKYRSFKNAEECWNEMQKHRPFGWIKDKGDGHYSMVTTVDPFYDDRNYIRISGDYNLSFAKTMDVYTFADGTPFGINIEEE